MKHILSASTLCAAILFLGSAIQSHAATIEFLSSSPGGDLTTAGVGSAATVLGIGSPSPDAPEIFDTLMIFNDGSVNGNYTPIYLKEIYNSTTDTLTVSGTLNPYFANLSTTTNLVTIVFSSAGLTANATSSNVALNFPTDVVSITLGTTFASDLGLPTSLSPVDLLGLTDVGQSNGDTGNYDITSASLVLDSNAPEPGSWLLMTLGSALIVLAARRRSSRVG